MHGCLHRTLRILAGFLVLAAAAASARAADVTKANNTDDLNLASSWVGGSAPGSGDTIVWDSTVTAANIVLLGADLDVQGVRIANPGGNVTINAGNTLTLGSAGIDMSASTRNLNIQAPVKLSAAQVWNASNRLLDTNGNKNFSGINVDNQGHTLTVQAAENTNGGVDLGNVTGGGGIIKNGAGWLRMHGNAYDFTGDVVLNEGIFVAFDVNSLGSGGSALTLAGGRLVLTRGLNVDYGRNTTVSGDAEIFNTRPGGGGAQNYTLGTLSIGANTLTVNRISNGPTAGSIIFGDTTLTGNSTFNVGDHGTDPAALNQLRLGAVGESGGSRDLLKSGGGTLILSGASSYTGTTTISDGILALAAGGSLDGSSAITVASDAVFDISAINSGLTIATDQLLAGAGSILGSLSFGSDSKLAFSSSLTIDSGTVNFDGFGIDDITGLDGTVVSEGSYSLLGGDASFDLTGAANVGAANAADIGGGRLAYFDGAGLQVIVVPEPTGLLLLGGGGICGGLALLGRRLRTS